MRVEVVQVCGTYPGVFSYHHYFGQGGLPHLGGGWSPCLTVSADGRDKYRAEGENTGAVKDQGHEIVSRSS
jgi:hypothetical protein